VIKEAFKDPEGRRDFLKTTALAGVAATIPGTSLLCQNAVKSSELKAHSAQKKLLCLCSSPTAYAQLVQSIKSEMRPISFKISQASIT
jgi:hypothetical protein